MLLAVRAVRLVGCGLLLSTLVESGCDTYREYNTLVGLIRHDNCTSVDKMFPIIHDLALKNSSCEKEALRQLADHFQSDAYIPDHCRCSGDNALQTYETHVRDGVRDHADWCRNNSRAYRSLHYEFFRVWGGQRVPACRTHHSLWAHLYHVPNDPPNECQKDILFHLSYEFTHHSDPCHCEEKMQTTTQRTTTGHQGHTAAPTTVHHDWCYRHYHDYQRLWNVSRGCLSANSVWHYLQGLHNVSVHCYERILSHMQEIYRHVPIDHNDGCTCSPSSHLVNKDRLHHLDSGHYSECRPAKDTTYDDIERDLFTHITQHGCRNHNYLWPQFSGVQHISVNGHQYDCLLDLINRTSIDYPHTRSDPCHCTKDSTVHHAVTSASTSTTHQTTTSATHLCSTTTPCRNGATCLDTPGGYNCACTSGWTGVHCEKALHFCSTHTPCQNGGTCVDTASSYNCMCSSGWSGVNCENDLDECLLYKFCQNGATCSNTPGGFSCQCAAGWTGGQCQSDIDECQIPDLCLNGGLCNNSRGSFSCHCSDGWTGLHCELDINECLTPGLCHNGGTCVNVKGTFGCSCVSGWTGDHCETDIDECLMPDMCRNGGSCNNSQGSFSCICSSGWTGLHCESDINECLSPGWCSDGEICVNLQGTYSCSCLPEWTGVHCKTDLRPKCNHTCTLDAVILSQSVPSTRAAACSGSSTRASNDALPMTCCGMNESQYWSQGTPLQPGGLCIESNIPPYTPVAAYNGGRLIAETAGIFYACIKNNQSGFLMIRQDCNSAPQLQHVDGTSGSDPSSYYFIY